MCHGYHQLDMTGALTTHLLLGHFHTASVAHYTLVAYALVFSAGALKVLGRTEDTLAKQSITLGLVGTVVDGLRFCYFTKRVFQHLFRRSQSNGYLGEIALYLCIFFKSHSL